MSEMKHSSKAEIFNKKAWSRCASRVQTCTGEGSQAIPDIYVKGRRQIVVDVPNRFKVENGKAIPVGYTGIVFSEQVGPFRPASRSFRRKSVQIPVYLSG